MEQRLAAPVDLAKVNAVETDEAVLRAQPQKPVARLQDGVNGRLKKAFLLTPDAMCVLGQGFTWIER